MRPLPLFFALLLALCASTLHAADNFLPGVKRIVFLGDSVTHGGGYVEDFELYLFARHPERKFEVIDIGLSSETVSGLSEDGHAGGKFPRPDLHERLDRALPKTKPDLVFACYGMNDGIYLPLDEARFAKFREGMDWLHDKVTAAGAQIIHVTPPTFHALSARPGPDAEGKMPTSLLGGYNLVLDRYAAWLLEQRSKGWRVIDIHGPMNAFIDAQRKTNPDFVFAKDGVHPNADGHALIADQLIAALVPGDAAWWQKFRTDLAANPKGAELRKLVHQHVHMLGDAWLSDIGHKRPGVAQGLPVPEAEAKAAELEGKIRALVTELPPH
ncbi:MAG: SGNH/GDSL hydrolase family protein [Chthoniobacter sp.]|uniref:SGNH/GDSL hydrolase family protein n=1 Tax=Chthoniobacter sp. TaxID=2510640 RepID=UPI0032A76540